nr:uncharacterized protein LOC113729261 [Coffea arabica]
MKRKFLKKYFPASQVASLQKEICGIKQSFGESFYEYWEIFKNLCTSCSQHQISEQLLIQYFYESLLYKDRNIIDVASAGALMNKTSREAWELIEGMAESSQQFSTREDIPTHHVNEVNISSMQKQLVELTSMVHQIAMGNMQYVKICGICKEVSHPTDGCLMLQEESAEQVNMAGNMPMPRMQYDPYSNTYNSEWRDHPNFSYRGNRQHNFSQYRQQGFQSQYPPKSQPSSSNSRSSLEDIVKSLATSTAQFQQKNRSSMKILEDQISQMTTSINYLESHIFEKFPS